MVSIYIAHGVEILITNENVISEEYETKSIRSNQLHVV